LQYVQTLAAKYMQVFCTFVVACCARCHSALLNAFQQIVHSVTLAKGLRNLDTVWS